MFSVYKRYDIFINCNWVVRVRKTSARVRKISVRVRKTSVRVRKTSVRVRKTSVRVRKTSVRLKKNHVRRNKEGLLFVKYFRITWPLSRIEFLPTVTEIWTQEDRYQRYCTTDSQKY